MIVELCIHNKWEPHHVTYDSGTVTQTWCEGGRPIEIDMDAAVNVWEWFEDGSDPVTDGMTGRDGLRMVVDAALRRKQ